MTLVVVLKVTSLSVYRENTTKQKYNTSSGKHEKESDAMIDGKRRRSLFTKANMNRFIRNTRDLSNSDPMHHLTVEIDHNLYTYIIYCCYKCSIWRFV